MKKSKLTRHIVIDVEADGPCPHLYSMVCFAAVCLEADIEPFYGRTAPVSDRWIPEALAVSGFTRDEHLGFEPPEVTMQAFLDWCGTVSGERLISWSDNPAFDWQFVNYYLWRFRGQNPLGFSMRRIGDLYAGYKGSVLNTQGWKKRRQTVHDHNPLNDALGNAEALRSLIGEYEGG
ncbi:MAG TPA: hypothetical protein VK862_19075 [Afifellaceae bacterium]|nr:hypothetical protein [Afifellaceae bacterium]